MGIWASDVAETPGEPYHFAAPVPPQRASRAPEVIAAAITIGILAVVGVGVGLAWAAVGPHVAVIITADGPSVQPGGGDEFFAAEGSFALIGLGVGLLSGVLGWFAAARWRGPLLMAALVVGGVAGAVVAWRVGRHVGLAQYPDLLRSTDVGREFNRPVQVRAKGVLLAQPIAAALTYIVFASWTIRPDLRRQGRRDASP